MLFSLKESGEGENELKLAMVNEYAVSGINLLLDAFTGGTCFHIVSLLEVPVKKTVVALDNILGKYQKYILEVSFCQIEEYEIH